ncbi:MAG: response regulator transcription factor [Paracoccaceae bacterium]|nr:response regulator transcription factor [Paracoccaceae bacterium]
MRVLVAETTWNTSAVAHDLTRGGFLVTRANNGEEMLLFVRDAIQDVVVFDVDLGDITAERAARSLRMYRDTLPVIAIAEGADRVTVARLYKAGADHVYTDLPEPEELAARIRAFARRSAGYPSPEVTLGPVTVNLDTRRVAVGDIALALTPAEYELLEHLTLRRQRIVSRDHIMTHLYGLDDAPDSKIIDVHLSRIRKKLRTAGADPRQLRTMNGRGLSFGGFEQRATAA